MAKDPAFLFYSQDFLTGVQDLTMEERGQYITLLCLHHQKGRLTKKVIQLSCHGNATADVMAKFRQDESGLFFNERLEEEVLKRKKHCEKQSDRAKEGWKNRKNDATAYATAMPLEDENENVNENVIEKENKEFGKSENLFEGKEIVPTLCRIWYNKFISYAKDQDQDFKAVGEILKFMVRQHAITDLNAARSQIEATFTQVADFVSKDNFWKNKPLKTIAKNIQEFYNKIKNVTDEKQEFRNSLRAAFDERYSKTG